MNYRTQANSVPTKLFITPNSSNIVCENKESIFHSPSTLTICSTDLPLHRQITQRLQSDSNRKQKTFNKHISPISTTTHKSKLLHVFDNIHPAFAKNIYYPYKSNSVLAKSPVESFHELSEFRSVEPKSTKNQDSANTTHLFRTTTTKKDLYQEKDKLISELKELAEQLKTPMNGVDSKKGKPRGYSSEKQRSTNQRNQDEIAYQRIVQRIEDLNNGYQQFLELVPNSDGVELAQTKQEEVKSIEEGGARSPNVFEKVEIEKRTALFHELEEEMQNVKDQLKQNGEMLLSIQEIQTHPPVTTDSLTPKKITTPSSPFKKSTLGKSPKVVKGEKSLHLREIELKEEMERFEKERGEYVRRKLDEEQKLKNKKLKLDKKNEELKAFQDELNKKQEEMIEKEKKLTLSEKSFEQLARKLEEQSEELIKQKVEYNSKVEAFNKNLQKFEKDKTEFLKYERDFYSRNIDLKGEYGKLEALKKEMYFEKEALETQKEESQAKVKELALREKIIKTKEDEIKKVERVINERSLRVEEEMATLNKEKFDFMENVETLEKRMKEKQEQLAEWEKSLNTRKEMYDDIEIKLLGMKLNEEMWQKKRDIEVANLQEKMASLAHRERELEKKEQKLNKALQEKKKAETPSSAISKLRFSVTTPTSPTFQDSPKKAPSSSSTTNTPKETDVL